MFLRCLKNVSIKYLQVLDFFNSHMDAQRENGDWSVNEVLQVIIVNCRSWRGDGMKVSCKYIFLICGLLSVWKYHYVDYCLVFLRLYLFLADVYSTALHI